MMTLQQVLAQHPTLSDVGFGPGDAIRLDEFEFSVRWLHDKPRIKLRGRVGSYGLKHVMERLTGVYVTNGAFIAAALALGIRVQHTHGVNASLGLAIGPLRKLGRTVDYYL